MDARKFISNFRKFKNIVLEECGEIEDNVIVRLFYLYLRQPKSPKYPFTNSTYITELFDSFAPYFNYKSLDPDSDENNDEL